MQTLSSYINISQPVLYKLFLSLVIFIVLTTARYLLNLFILKRIEDHERIYYMRRTFVYIYTVLLVLMIGRVWIKGLESITTFLGLASAGLAIAMHDTVANIAGWVFIISRKPFKVGDRIQITETAGDVIDIRFLQFSVVEIGNWVDSDQSTGRIIHIPNSKVLRDPLANYQIGFEYIWNEIPVLITFESNWKKAKKLLSDIVVKHAEHLSQNAQEQIRRAAEKYFIHYSALTPIVYTSVRDSGVLLTLRYMVDPRQRRSTEQQIWESVLDAFNAEPDISLAYPTTRFYKQD
ncbi:MAG: mechanosensitive ion channel family protein [candidate division KSB1 bacterium]|nr:mechanosensitive ion channel family protein [candidate division KSB1 bacterium]